MSGKLNRVLGKLRQVFNAALEREECDVVDTMLANGYIPDPKCIRLVCENGNITLLQTLLKYDMDLQAGLFISIESEQTHLLNYLYVAGVNINCSDVDCPDVDCLVGNGSTPLHYAFDVETCKWLLDMGAVQTSNHIGETPLHIACSSGDIDIVKLLLTYGNHNQCSQGIQSISLFSDRGITPLTESLNDLDMLKLLLSYQQGIQTIGLINEYGETALFHACVNRNVQAVRLLLSYDEGRNSILQGNNNKRTPLHIACSGCYVDIVKLLLSHEQGVQSIILTNQDGETPLYIACYKGHINIVKLLLSYEQGVQSISIANQDGETPLYIARYKGYEEIAKMLLFHSQVNK